MYSFNPGPLQVSARTRHVVDYHYDDTTPEKPLYLLIPGGLIALISLALIVYVGYITFYKNDMLTHQGLTYMSILAPFYIGGVFMFCYGYELYDLPKALGLTALIVFITLSAVVIVAVLLIVARAMSDSKPSRSSSTSSSFDSDSGSSQPSSSGSGGGDWLSGIGPIFVGAGSPRGAASHGAPAGHSGPPRMQCPHCDCMYVPSETGFVCPDCGAASPDPSRF